MNTNNNKNLLSKVIIRSKNVTRWANVDSIGKNHNAGHMWSTTIACDILGRIEEYLFGHKVNFLDLLRRAIYHDVIEVETGDILSNVKHITPETKAYLSGIEKIKFDSELKPSIPEPFKEELEEYILNPKNNLISIEGKILAVADKVDGLIEAIAEVKKGNSNYLPYLISESEAILKLNVGCGLYFLKYYLLDFGLTSDYFGSKVSEFIETYEFTDSNFIENHSRFGINI